MIRRRHPIKESAKPSPVDLKLELEEALLQRGVLEGSCIHRLEACISVELLDNLPRLLITAPQIARCRARFVNPIVEREPEHLAAFWGGPGITVPVESVAMDVCLGAASS